MAEGNAAENDASVSLPEVDSVKCIASEEESVEITANNSDAEHVGPAAEAHGTETGAESKKQTLVLNQKFAEIQDTLDNLLFNVQSLVRNQAVAIDVATLQKENEAYRSDSNIKLMRAYGIDAMIRMYQSICDKLFIINHPDTSYDLVRGRIEKDVYLDMLKNLDREFKRLGIKVHRSEMGDDVDEDFMSVYGSNGEDVDESLTMVDTDNQDLKDTVKESVCPAFIWTVPALGGVQKEWVMEAERICMYK